MLAFLPHQVLVLVLGSMLVGFIGGVPVWLWVLTMPGTTRPAPPPVRPVGERKEPGRASRHATR